MSFKSGILNNLSSHLSYFDCSDLSRYSNIETAYDYTPRGNTRIAVDKGKIGILVGKNGDIGSVIQYAGSRQMLGIHEIPALAERMANKLVRIMNNDAFKIQLYFSRNPDQSKNLIKEIIKASRTVANKMKLNLNAIFDEDEKVMPGFIAREDVFFVIWTTKSAMSSSEYSKVAKEEIEKTHKNKILRKLIEFGSIDVQKPWLSAKKMLEIHYSAVDGFVKDANESISNIYTSDRNSDSSFRILMADESLCAIRRSIDPSNEISSWKPYLQFDEHDGNWDKNNGVMKNRRIGRNLRTDTDFTNQVIFAPHMDGQLFLESGQRISSNICQIGQLYYATQDMSLAPEKTEPFVRLLSRMVSGEEFPWRMSFQFFGGQRPGQMMQSLFSGMLRATTTNGHNANIRAGLSYIKNLKEQNKPVANVRVSFTTWCHVSKGLEAIQEQSSAMARAVEGWGNIQVTDGAGDPVASTMSTVLGLGMGGTAKIGSMPLADVLTMLPFSRDSSPFETGSLLARTEDGRPLPLDFGSEKQNSFGEYIFGEPGSGKSVLMSLTNLGLILNTKQLQNVDASGLDLPIIRLIDVGFSQQGLYEIVKDALPENKKHLIVYKSLDMSRDRINPFDLPLGSRKPPEFLNSLIYQFILQLAMAPGEEKVPAHMDELVSALVRDIYRVFSDQSGSGASPKSYERGVVPEIDDALERLDLKISEGVAWYRVMDELAFKGEIHLAYLAQREAVPTLRDLSTYDMTEVERNFSGIQRAESGASLVDDLKVTLKAICEKYPIFSEKTNFDIADARIMILDIQKVVGATQSKDDIKQTSVMYMLAAIKMGGDFFTNVDSLHEYNPEYNFYHKPRIEKLYSTIKRFCLDEAHRAKGSVIIGSFIDKFFREGRKFNIIVTIASQRIDDIDKDTFENITTVWCLSSNNNPDKVANILHLSPTAKRYVAEKLTGPTSKGAPFLIQMKMKGGIHEHYGLVTMGPQKIWAFSTTAEDVLLRNKLSIEIGTDNAKKTLAALYPNGSVKKIVDIRAKERMNDMSNNQFEADEVPNKIIDEMVVECKKAYFMKLMELSGIDFSKENMKEIEQ